MKILAFGILLLSGCSTVNLSQIHNDTDVICHSKLLGNIEYLKSHRQDNPSTEFSEITISTITDIHGKVWNINSQEWTQYICTEKALP